ncbi:zinc finger protein HD1 isoform X2 [Sorghum bicolor]|uniref:zinc finger protein HD1 isoform X2 n=1 Tax=Sorghum bicolor TaxID=4558 RepID=UPI000B4246A0|nr:zinc finger protein HD1 isoform X2 [Sorghum bicolor]|eukprot:XP_021305899.1 zinc finger protein HD1 isoform X2 [Sorghum bicolor]
MNYNFSSNALDEEEVAGRGGEGGSCAAAPAWARPCDGCRAAPSVVYCHADAAYLCASCDVRVHAANRVASRHERVRVCEACERAPAVLACRADAAALCVVCDAQVHSANPLAGRHQRVPVLPLPVAAIPAASVLAEAAATAVAVGDKQEEEVDSWLLLTNTKDPVSDNNNCNCSSSSNNNISSSNTSTFYADVDEYFDLVGYNSYCDNHINSNPKQYGMQERQQQQQLLLQKEFGDKEGSEHVVPASQVAMANEQQQSGYGVIGVEQAASMTAAISFSSSMEVGIVPDNMATTTDMPNSGILLTPAEAISLFSSGSSLQMPLHLTSMDREARVLRYKEKKKSRKFAKTIRYATRKTYAEARPRIKGRFAKRSSDMEIEVDQMFSSAALSSDGSYGTVLWF